MGAILGEAKRLIGAGNVADIWKSSGVTWKDFVGKEEREVDDIVNKYVSHLNMHQKFYEVRAARHSDVTRFIA